MEVPAGGWLVYLYMYWNISCTGSSINVHTLNVHVRTMYIYNVHVHVYTMYIVHIDTVAPLLSLTQVFATLSVRHFYRNHYN